MGKNREVFGKSIINKVQNGIKGTCRTLMNVALYGREVRMIPVEY